MRALLFRVIPVVILFGLAGGALAQQSIVQTNDCDPSIQRMLEDPTLAGSANALSSLDSVMPHLPILLFQGGTVHGAISQPAELPPQAQASAKPLILLRDPSGLFKKVVTDRENPALCGKGCDGPVVGGTGRSPLCPSATGPPTTNENARSFVERFPAVAQSVAGVVRRENDQWHLMGTAVLVSQAEVASAGHVVQYMQNQYGIARGTLPVSQADFFLVFGLTVDRFPKGIPDDYDFAGDPTAVAIPVGTPATSSSRPDVGILRLSRAINRPVVEIAVDDIANERELALIGVPGPPRGADATDPPTYRKNYALCGVDDLERAVVLRVGTGKFLRYETGQSSEIFQFHIDTMGGNSGSAILDATTGKMVGINVGTKNDLRLKFNKGVSGASVESALASIRADIASVQTEH